MKKFLALLILIALLVPASGLAEYSPELGMTMNEFVQKYNSQGSSLESPLLALKNPYNWSESDTAQIAYYNVANDSDVYISLFTNDKSKTKDLASGLDYILITCPSLKDFLSFVTVSTKCIDVFSQELFTGYPMGPYFLTAAMKYYYENRGDSEDFSSFQSINSESGTAIEFAVYDGNYCLLIEGNAQ